MDNPADGPVGGGAFGLGCGWRQEKIKSDVVAGSNVSAAAQAAPRDPIAPTTGC